MNDEQLWQLIRRHESAALAANGAGVDEYCDKLAVFVDTERALAAAFTEQIERIAELEKMLARLQWFAPARWPTQLSCLVCHELSGHGHAVDCKLAALLPEKEHDDTDD